ncbi:MAG TPA: YkvA family protein [Candidatus Kryptonia bacterium]|nr:YkvA family protein [Candidatus Kryptonia bacterium]
MPLAAVVYLRVLIDRRADRLGQLALTASLVYAIVPWDLIPDNVAIIGVLDDAIIITAASRWFMYRCPAAMIERHARVVETWRDRTAKIQAYRRAVRRKGNRNDSTGAVE